MATSKINNPYPNYSTYSSLDNVAQGGTFTVPHTGFYTLYVSANAGVTAAYMVRKGGASGYTVAYIQAVGGGAFGAMFYFEANTQYYVTLKSNTKNVYLYY